MACSARLDGQAAQCHDRHVNRGSRTMPDVNDSERAQPGDVGVRRLGRGRRHMARRRPAPARPHRHGRSRRPAARRRDRAAAGRSRSPRRCAAPRSSAPISPTRRSEPRGGAPRRRGSRSSGSSVTRRAAVRGRRLRRRHVDVRPHVRARPAGRRARARARLPSGRHDRPVLLDAARELRPLRRDHRHAPGARCPRASARPCCGAPSRMSASCSSRAGVDARHASAGR